MSEARDTMLVFAVLLVAAFVQVAFGTPDRLQTAQAVLWLVLICAAGARQTLLTRDNIALRRGLERRVREQTADLRRLVRQNEVLLTSVGDGIYGVDHEGRVTFVNPSGAQILGYEPDQLLGLNAHEEFHAPTPEGAPYPWEGCYVTDAIRHGLVTSAEADVYLRTDGETFPVEITASPIMDEDVVRGAVVVFRDVTQRREVDRMKNEFLSVVSHELRTPLTSIRGSLGLLAGGTLGDLTPRAHVDGQHRAREHRAAHPADQRHPRPRADRVRHPPDGADRASTRSTCCARRRPRWRASPTTAAYASRSADAPGRVLADRDRIVQTLTNLLGNAIKFSSDGRRGPARRHRATTPRSCSRSATRAAASRRTSWRRSSSGSSRWTPPTPGRRAAPASAWPSAAASSSGTAAGSGPRASWASAPPSCSRCPARAAATRDAGDEAADAPLLLVCDDDPATVDLFSAMLRRHGYRTLGVTDGAEAVQRAVAEQPAALLLDLRMPGTTGAQVLAELKAATLTRHIPVVVVSGLSPESEPQLTPDTDGWLIKPVTEDRLVETVATALAGRESPSSSVLLVEDDEDLAGVIADAARRPRPRGRRTRPPRPSAVRARPGDCTRT